MGLTGDAGRCWLLCLYSFLSLVNNITHGWRSFWCLGVTIEALLEDWLE